MFSFYFTGTQAAATTALAAVTGTGGVASDLQVAAVKTFITTFLAGVPVGSGVDIKAYGEISSDVSAATPGEVVMTNIQLQLVRLVSAGIVAPA